MTNSGIDIQDLLVAYGRTVVLENVTLRVPEGCTTLLLGGNGTGKTTLLQTCIGVLKARAGAIAIDGIDPQKNRSNALRRIGYVPDKPDVYGWMRPSDLFGLLKTHYPTWNAKHARALCEKLRVPLNTCVRSMSKGQGMKTMLVAALAHEPRVLLLDEPFGGMDVATREDILRGVIDVLAAGSRTVLISTHDLDMAARLADRVAVLENGTITREGTLDEIAGETAPATGLRDVVAASATRHVDASDRKRTRAKEGAVQ